MKITKIKIKNLFGIKETELDGRNVEVTGTNGTGKTSVIDAVKLALTNDSARDYVIKQGEQEGEIIVETDTGLYIDRKKRTGKADYRSIKDGGKDVAGPEAMLKTLFTPLQIAPVAFIQMDKKEQNRLILDLIEFDWDLNWIKEQFGEIPRDVNYEQNILQVLNDIQAKDGYYYKTRQDINRDLRNKKAFVEEIAETIPADYDAEKWEKYDLGDTYRRIEHAKVSNGRIERAKVFKDSYDNKVRGYEAEKEIAVSAEKDKIAAERDELTSSIGKTQSRNKSG